MGSASTISVALIWQRRSPVESVMASSLVSLVALSLCLAFASGVGFTKMGTDNTDITSWCRIEWEFPLGCGDLMDPITNALQNWMYVNQCGFSPRGETCDYIHEDYPVGSAIIPYAKRGVNITFDGGFVSDIGFVIYVSNDYCKVTGDAFTTKLDVTDPDFNYCTLDWIMMDSRLTALYGFIQNTSDGMCPEIREADCTDNLDLLARAADDLTHDFDDDMAEFMSRN